MHMRRKEELIRILFRRSKYEMSRVGIDEWERELRWELELILEKENEILRKQSRAQTDTLNGICDLFAEESVKHLRLIAKYELLKVEHQVFVDRARECIEPGPVEMSVGMIIPDCKRRDAVNLLTDLATSKIDDE